MLKRPSLNVSRNLEGNEGPGAVAKKDKRRVQKIPDRLCRFAHKCLHLVDGKLADSAFSTGSPQRTQFDTLRDECGPISEWRRACSRVAEAEYARHRTWFAPPPDDPPFVGGLLGHRVVEIGGRQVGGLPVREMRRRLPESVGAWGPRPGKWCARLKANPRLTSTQPRRSPSPPRVRESGRKGTLAIESALM